MWDILYRYPSIWQKINMKTDSLRVPKISDKPTSSQSLFLAIKSASHSSRILSSSVTKVPPHPLSVVIDVLPNPCSERSHISRSHSNQHGLRQKAGIQETLFPSKTKHDANPGRSHHFENDSELLSCARCCSLLPIRHI